MIWIYLPLPQWAHCSGSLWRIPVGRSLCQGRSSGTLAEQMFRMFRSGGKPALALAGLVLAYLLIWISNVRLVVHDAKLVAASAGPGAPPGGGRSPQRGETAPDGQAIIPISRTSRTPECLMTPDNRSLCCPPRLRPAHRPTLRRREVALGHSRSTGFVCESANEGPGCVLGGTYSDHRSPWPPCHRCPADMAPDDASANAVCHHPSTDVRCSLPGHVGHTPCYPRGGARFSVDSAAFLRTEIRWSTHKPPSTVQEFCAFVSRVAVAADRQWAPKTVDFPTTRNLPRGVAAKLPVFVGVSARPKPPAFGLKSTWLKVKSGPKRYYTVGELVRLLFGHYSDLHTVPGARSGHLPECPIPTEMLPRDGVHLALEFSAGSLAEAITAAHGDHNMFKADPAAASYVTPPKLRQSCPHPLGEDFGHCGPQFSGTSCPEESPFCSEGNGWCGNTEAHANAQASTAYDYCKGAYMPPTPNPALTLHIRLLSNHQPNTCRVSSVYLAVCLAHALILWSGAWIKPLCNLLQVPP